MKQPEQMNDEELAVAVATEVLGIPVVKYENQVIHWETDDNAGYVDILSPEGREAIENELERRGWTWEQSCVGRVYSVFVYITDGSDYLAAHKSKHRALATAALKAVRGEG